MRTVADLVERWYEWRQGMKEISPTTLLGYRLQIDRRIIPALGRLPVRRLDVETLDTFYAELRKRGNQHGGPLSASQIRSVHTVLSGSLQQAVAWGWIAHNPARLATPPSVQRADIAPPPVEQVAELLATALKRSPKLGLFLRLAVGLAIGVTTTAARALEPGLAAATPEHLSAWGALHLTALVAVARQDDAWAVRQLLGEARTTADRLAPECVAGQAGCSPVSPHPSLSSGSRS